MILSILAAAIAIPVLIAACCRLIPMHVATHKLGWIGLYLSFALGAVASLGEASQFRASWPELLLLAGSGFQIWLSRMTWRKGPPLFTRLDYREAS